MSDKKKKKDGRDEFIQPAAAWRNTTTIYDFLNRI